MESVEMIKNCFGMHGWKEFHRNRKDILGEFDRLYEITENRPVRTAHGTGVEAYLRKWLSEFLPKKWAVTSGYIIPTLYRDKIGLYHYDIIIYDNLSAPVLWTEGNEDDSVQGKYRAIPAKNVAGVLEVKSRLNKRNVQEMVDKLSEIDRFRDQLPDTFFSSGIFIDLKEEDNGRLKILESMIAYKKVHGFMGAMVLRYEGDESLTGLIGVHAMEMEVVNRNFDKLAKPIDDLAIYMTEDGNVQISECGGGVIAVASSENSWSMTKTYSAMYAHKGMVADITWSRSGFAVFCIDMLSSLEGLPFNDENRPSFGRIFDSFERKPVERQPVEQKEGMPFLDISIGQMESGNEVEIVDVNDGMEISFCVEVSNLGDVGAVISDDYFKTKVNLPPGKSGVKISKIKALPKNGQENIDEFRKQLEAEGVCVPYRISYFPSDGEKIFYAIEKRIKLNKNKAVFDAE